jgi:hypothetical protein
MGRILTAREPGEARRVHPIHDRNGDGVRMGACDAIKTPDPPTPSETERSAGGCASRDGRRGAGR